MSLKKPAAKADHQGGDNLDLLAGACVGLGVDGLLALMGQVGTRRGALEDLDGDQRMRFKPGRSSDTAGSAKSGRTGSASGKVSTASSLSRILDV